MHIWSCFPPLQPLISVPSPPNPTPPHSLQRQAYMGFYQAQDRNYANINTSIWKRYWNPLRCSLTAYNGIGKRHTRGRFVPPTMWRSGWWRCLAVGLPRASLYALSVWELNLKGWHRASPVSQGSSASLTALSFACVCLCDVIDNLDTLRAWTAERRREREDGRGKPGPHEICRFPRNWDACHS